MRQFIRLSFVALGLASLPSIAIAQDTLLGRKALSVEIGYSIDYPILFSQYQYSSSYSPVSGAGPQILASYSYSFLNHRHSILGVMVKGGYFQNHYLYQVSPLAGGASATQSEYKTYLGAGVGFYMIKKVNKVGFYNEVNIFGKTQIQDHFSNSNQQPQSIDLACEGANNIFINFQSGISFYFIKHLAIMPYLAYPVFEVSNVVLWFPKQVTKYSASVNDIYYSGFSAGVCFTYYL